MDINVPFTEENKTTLIEFRNLYIKYNSSCHVYLAIGDNSYQVEGTWELLFSVSLERIHTPLYKKEVKEMSDKDNKVLILGVVTVVCFVVVGVASVCHKVLDQLNIK